MILADKIIELRKKSGWSQEELAEKLNVSRQSVSKWESAASIPDIKKILDMSVLFGVSTDYLLKDEIESEVYTDSEDSENIRRVSLDEATGFISSVTSYGRIIALAVMLCILSPIPLIVLGGLSESPYSCISDVVASAIGIAYLLISVAIAVLIFIISDQRFRGKLAIIKGDFELAYGVSGIIGEKKQIYEPKYTILTAIAVCICILSALPLIIVSVLNTSEQLIICMVALLLALVSIAVYIFISSGMLKGGFSKLLHEGDYSEEELKNNERTEKVGGIYWPCIVAIYLLASFITNRWDITWLVWPVAGLIFAAISVAVKSTKK